MFLFPDSSASSSSFRSDGALRTPELHQHLRLDVRKKKYFIMRVVRPWPRLPSEVGDAPSLEPFQARLDGALSTLIWLEMSLLLAGWLD